MELCPRRATQQTSAPPQRSTVSPLAHNMFRLSIASPRLGTVIQPTSSTNEYGRNLVLKGTDGALRRLADRTIVWTHVQFAVAEFESPLIAMDSAPSRVR